MELTRWTVAYIIAVKHIYDLFQLSSIKRHQQSLISTSGFREQTPQTRNGLSQWGNINVASNKMREVLINCNTCMTCSIRALLNATNSHLFLLPVSKGKYERR